MRMKVFLAGLMAVGLCLGGVGVAKAADSAFDFKGNTTTQKFDTSICSLFVDSNNPFKSAEGGTGTCFPKSGRTIGGAEANMFYYLWNHHFDGLVAMVPVAEYPRVQTVLSRKYGEPDNTFKKPLTVEGKQVEQIVLRWDFSDGHLWFSKYAEGFSEPLKDLALEFKSKKKIAREQKAQDEKTRVVDDL